MPLLSSRRAVEGLDATAAENSSPPRFSNFLRGSNPPLRIRGEYWAIEMRCSPHPPMDGPHLRQRSPYRALHSLHTRQRAGLPPAARPLLPPRWFPALAAPHGPAAAAVSASTSR